MRGRILLYIFLAVQSLAKAQSTNKRVDPASPVTIMNAELKVLHDSRNNNSYTIYIWTPDSYNTTDSTYSVLYLTDANTYFGMLTDMSHNLQWTNEMPETIIVGIAYSLDSEKTMDDKWSKWLALRLRDFTPASDITADKDMGTAIIKSGGAPDFLRFIREDVIPFIEKNYRIKKSERTYAGFSLGGLFGLYAMLESPGLFQQYIVGSPSIWYHNKYITTIEDKFLQTHDNLAAKLYLSAGSLEEEINAGMVRNMLEFTSRLRSNNYKGLVVKTDILENQTHQSSPPVCFLNGLNFLYRH